MKKIAAFFTLVLGFTLSNSLYADTVKFKIPTITGKITANNLEVTDWQTVMHCHFNNRGTKKEFYRYPQTNLKKIDSNVYLLKIKATGLYATLAHSELMACSYKLILIGKNLSTHQLAFGEFPLLGRESGTMSESELLSLQDINIVTKVLSEKTRDLTITFGKDGGIVEDI